jgi:hypothetical protein
LTSQAENLTPSHSWSPRLIDQPIEKQFRICPAQTFNDGGGHEKEAEKGTSRDQISHHHSEALKPEMIHRTIS